MSVLKKVTNLLTPLNLTIRFHQTLSSDGAGRRTQSRKVNWLTVELEEAAPTSSVTVCIGKLMCSSYYVSVINESFLK